MEEPNTVKPRRISNSEVTAFLACRRMYEYAFMMQIEPKTTPDHLARGGIGHNFFERYWKARLAGFNHEQSKEKAMAAFSDPIVETPIDKILYTQSLCIRYLDAHEAEFITWKPLGVEEEFDLPLTPTLNMVIKYDLYFLDTKTDKRYILDWKFSYNFWSFEDHDVNGQMPKYIAVMQANKYQVDGGYLEEIRSRPLGVEKARDARNLWRRTLYNPSMARKRAVLDQHIRTSLEIEQHRSLPDSERRKAALPVLNKYGTCRYCSFVSLCNSELEGKSDLTVDIRVGFKQSTYGYNKTDPLDDL